MKLYTRKDMRLATGKSKEFVYNYLFINKIAPVKILDVKVGQSSYFYSQKVCDEFILYCANRKSKLHLKYVQKIGKNIFCDLDLNLVIESKMNYTPLSKLNAI
jgi:hypothetical protein